MSVGDRHPRIDLGAYLLAILPAGEEAAITAHLAQCDECVQTLMELSDAVPPLRRLDPTTIQAASAAGPVSDPRPAPPSASPAPPSGSAAPPSGSAGTASESAAGAWAEAPEIARHRVRLRSQPSRRVRWSAGLAAVAATAAVIAVPAALGGDGASAPVGQPSGRATASSSPTGVALQPVLGAVSRTFGYTGSDTVTVTYAATANGSSVNVRCRSGSDWTPEPGDASRTYELWIIRQDGAEVLVRSWPPVRGDATFPGWVGFSPQQFRTFQLRDGDGHVLSEASA